MAASRFDVGSGEKVIRFGCLQRLVLNVLVQSVSRINSLSEATNASM